MVLILAGKSGSGKDAIQNILKEEYGFQPIVSTTTRPIREGEEEGVAYHFISKEEFLKGIDEDRFLEYRSYDTLVDGKPDTWYYGSEKLNLDPNQDYVVVLDIQGAKDFVNYYGKDNCYTVEIQVDDAIREERASHRGSFDKTEWDRRAADDAAKFSYEKTSEICNAYVLNNEALQPTVDAVLNLFQEHKETIQQLIPEFMAQMAFESKKAAEIELVKPIEDMPYILVKQGNNEIALTTADVAAMAQKLSFEAIRDAVETVFREQEVDISEHDILNVTDDVIRSYSEGGDVWEKIKLHAENDKHEIQGEKFSDDLRFVRHNENFIEALYHDKRIMTYEKEYGYRYDENNSGIMGEYSNLVGSFDPYCSEKEFQEVAKSCVQGLEHKDWEESGDLFKSKLIPELYVEFNVNMTYTDVEFEAYYKEDRIFHGSFNGDSYWLDDETCFKYNIQFDSDPVYVESCDIAKILSAANEYGKAILEHQKGQLKAAEQSSESIER